MRRLAVAVLASVLLMAGVSAAKADVFSVYADLPVQSAIKFEDSSVKAESVAGIKAGVTFPVFLGVGVEKYTIGLSDNAGDYSVSFVDVFFNLPLPLINVALGVGVGSGEFGDEAAQLYQDAPLTQLWASLGYNILPLLDVHIGYHSFRGRHPSRDQDLYGDINVEGTMISAGAKLGF